MATIRKKQLGRQEYFYLEHTIRAGNRIEKREHYLGTSIPKNIDAIRRDFVQKIYKDIYKQQWHPVLENIKKRYATESKQIPAHAAEEELAKFAIHFTYDTQRIEGSMLSLRETADLLEYGITPAAKPLRDVKEAEAHKELFYVMLKTTKDISLSLILDWHRKLFLSTKQDIAGRIRQHQVIISRSKFVPPSPVEVYPLLKGFFSWYNRNKRTMHPVELAAQVHLKLVTIHPFADGNGRISRLLMNFVLHKNKYPLLNIHYEGRNSYYKALERAQTKEQDHSFVQWFIKRYIKEHKRCAALAHV